MRALCRRAAGGYADGLGGAVGQLALRARAAGGERAARPPAARAARQLMSRRLDNTRATLSRAAFHPET